MKNIITTKDEILIKFGEKYSYNKYHSEFVASTSLLIFDALCEKFKLRVNDRILIHHASLVHDVGRFVTDKNHHKLTYTLCMYDVLLDKYNEKHKNLMCIIAYNHGKKLHKTMDKLTPKEHFQVLKLSAILRLSDSLFYGKKDFTDFKVVDAYIKDDLFIIITDVKTNEKIHKKVEAKQTLFNEIFNLKLKLEVR